MIKSLSRLSALLLLSQLPAQADIQFSLGSGGLKVKDEANDLHFSMGGRIQLDYSVIQNDLEGLDKTQSENTVFIRRARIFAAGEIKDWGFKAQFNIKEGSGGTPEDLYVQYKGFDFAKITVGKQKEFIGLEELESSKDISILERSPITEAFVIGRNYGVTAKGSWGHGVYQVGVFADDQADNADLDLQNPALTGRFVYSPRIHDEFLVHLGGSYSFRSTYQGGGDDLRIYGVELGTSYHAFHAQAEYLKKTFNVDIPFINREEELDQDGYYVQMGYVLTGEHRGHKSGAFKRIKPSSSYGAYEVVVRFDQGYGKYSDYGLSEGEGKSFVAGLNWYANNNVKIGLNYGQASSDANDDKGQSLRLRTQLVW